jgi:phosphatidylinositol alpha-mannosyltransferase
MAILIPGRRTARGRRVILPDLPQLPAEPDAHALRIALVTEYYYPHLGGVCEHVHFFGREARRRGHHVDIITSRIPGAEPMPDVIRIGRSQPVQANGSQARITLGPGLRRTMRRLLRDGGYDIVHVHSPLTPVLPLLAIDEAEVPVVGTFHTYFDHSYGYEWFNRYFQRRLDRLAAAIAVSPSTTVALNRYFTANWQVIPNGIDAQVFHPGAPRPAAVRADVPSILFLGRFDPRNGLDTLLDAFRIVKARGRRAQLVVVGDGPLRQHYHALAGPDPDIVFVGSVLDGREGYYANCSIYTCPTTKASFGITLLEAMACETPIVCSDILGFQDVVQNEREALMVPSGQPEALADALIRLIDNPDLRRQLGTRGRAEAHQYAWDRVADRVLGVYRAVIAPATVARRTGLR